MDFVKRRLFLIICGAAAFAGIALSAWAMRNKTIRANMETGAVIAGQLRRYEKGPTPKGADQPIPPINEQALKQLDDKIKTIEQHYKAVLAKAREINARPMLLPDVFPEPKTNSAPYNFRTAYRQAVFALPESLNEGREQTRGLVPTQHEVQLIQTLMDEKVRQETADTVGIDDAETAGRKAGKKDKNSLAGLTPDELVRQDARAQACVKRARSINCYMNPSALDVSPIVKAGTGTRPSPEEMWYAQMTYVIQKDMIDAIKQINAAAAKQLEAQQERPWVGNLPVKDVRAILIGRGGLEGLYVLEDAAGGRTAGPRRAGRDAARTASLEPGPVNAADVFTKRFSNPEYDVIHFAIHLVVDARDIPAILSGICKTNFYVPLTVSYSQVPYDTLFQGKVYGSEPIVLLSVSLEGYFFREIYQPFMPAGVKQLLNIQDASTG